MKAFDWLIEKGKVDSIQFIDNKATGKFIRAFRGPEDIPKLIAWAPPDCSFEQAIMYSINNPDADHKQRALEFIISVRR